MRQTRKAQVTSRRFSRRLSALCRTLWLAAKVYDWIGIQ